MITTVPIPRGSLDPHARCTHNLASHGKDIQTHTCGSIDLSRTTSCKDKPAPGRWTCTPPTRCKRADSKTGSSAAAGRCPLRFASAQRTHPVPAIILRRDSLTGDAARTDLGKCRRRECHEVGCYRVRVMVGDVCFGGVRGSMTRPRLPFPPGLGCMSGRRQGPSKTPIHWQFHRATDCINPSCPSRLMLCIHKVYLWSS